MTPAAAELVRQLLGAATTLHGWASRPPMRMQGQDLIPLTPASVVMLATLLEKAAAELMERKGEGVG